MHRHQRCDVMCNGSIYLCYQYRDNFCLTVRQSESAELFCISDRVKPIVEKLCTSKIIYFARSYT
jgi:hypothetical protein